MDTRNKLFAIPLVARFTSLGVVGCNKDDNGPAGPAPTPQPVVTEYTQAQTGWKTSSGTNLISTVIAQSPVPGYAARMGGIAHIWIGIYEHPVSTIYLQNTHNGNPGDYRAKPLTIGRVPLPGMGLPGRAQG